MMVSYTEVAIDGRTYRFSDERRVSGRPASIQFLNGRGVWRDVRNVDRSDAIWLMADRLPADRSRHVYAEMRLAGEA